MWGYSDFKGYADKTGSFRPPLPAKIRPILNLARIPPKWSENFEIRSVLKRNSPSSLQVGLFYSHVSWSLRGLKFWHKPIDSASHPILPKPPRNRATFTGRDRNPWINFCWSFWKIRSKYGVWVYEKCTETRWLRPNASILSADLFSPQFLLSYARQRGREEAISSFTNLAFSFGSRQTEGELVFGFPIDQFIFLVK